MNPNHKQLAQAARSWFHEPYEGMGYRAERRRWGTYWSHGHVYVNAFPLDQVSAFLDDTHTYYGDRAVHINVDDRHLDARLGPALLDAGCAPDSTMFFLAHVGPVPAAPTVPGLDIEPVNDGNIHVFAVTKLRAFSDADTLPDEVSRG